MDAQSLEPEFHRPKERRIAIKNESYHAIRPPPWLSFGTARRRDFSQPL
jgi:hypothetical protein